MDIIDSDLKGNSGAGLNDQTRENILEAMKWGRIVAIVGFVIFGLYGVIMTFSFIASLVSMNVQLIFTMLLSLGLIFCYFMPIYHLFQAATKLQDGIYRNNEAKITEGFKSLKFHFKWIAIIILVSIIIGIISLVFAASIGASLMNGGFR